MRFKIKYNLLLLLLLLLLFSVVIKAQGIGEYSINKYDNSNIIITYEYIFSKDSNNISKKTNSIKELLIGDNYSIFADNNLFKSDSLLDEMANNNSNELESLLFETYIKSKTRDYLLKDLKSNIYIYQSKIYTDKFQFESKIPIIKWILEKETKNILGYKSKKATCDFGGRSWIAWYTEEIPLDNGPYIFQGLPGLILEIEDTKNNFNFTVQKIGKIDKGIYLRNEKDILNVSKEIFYKTEKKFHENPSIYVNTKVYSSPNVEEKNSSIPKKIPYNPIELE